MHTIEQAYGLALRAYQAGRLDVAQQVCQQVLAQLPDQTDCLHLLASIELVSGRPDTAITHAQRAAKLDPSQPHYHLTLGLALKALNQTEAAVTCYLRAAGLCTHDAQLPEAASNLCNALRELGRYDEAIHWGRRAVAAAPNLSAAHNNLASAYKSAGQLDKALAHFDMALQCDPANTCALVNLGNTFAVRNETQEALACYRHALTQTPNDPLVHCALGHALYLQHKPDESLAAYRKALTLDAHCAEAHVRIINILRDQGRVALVDAALDGLRRVLKIDPNNDDVRRNLLFTLNYQLDADPVQVLADHKEWARPYENRADNAEPRFASIDPTPDRRLRVAYVSGDFKVHVCAHFLMPLIQAHDPNRVEVFAYAQVDKPDEISDRFKALCRWQPTVGLSDEQFAEKMREDRIDIAIDCAGHTGQNRLTALAYRPAPILATYLGYPNTTGLSAIQYRFTDAIASPPDIEQHHVEEPIRLPHGLSCYAPYRAVPDVNALPALSVDSNRTLTFGSLSNPAKINDRVIELWCRLLKQVPNSRLLVARETIKGDFLEAFLSNFRAHGIDDQRIVIRSSVVPGRHPIHVYHEIDIALDTFPYSGHTTVCEALWMGVPMVTLPLRTLASRMGTSVLHQAGLSGWIARDEQDYLEIAASLAGDLVALSRLRGTLREEVKNSPLADGPLLARQFEDAFTVLWRRYLDQRRARNTAAA